MSPSPVDPMKQIAEEIGRDLSRIIDRNIARAAEIPGFATVPMDVFRPMHEQLFRWTLKALSDDDELSTFRAEISTWENAVAAREELGIPIDSRLLGLQIAAKEILSAARDAAERLGIGSDDLVRFAQRIATWQTLATEFAVKRNRAAELRSARLDEQRKAAFLHDVLFGATTSELTHEAPAFGLSVQKLYRAIRARPENDAQFHELEAAVAQSATARQESALWGVVETDFVGIVESRPAVALDIAVGEGPPALLGSMSRSFQLASRALDVAIAFGFSGTFLLEELGPRGAILSEHELSQAFRERFVDPVSALGDFGSSLLETLRTYFRNGMRVDATAKELFIHPNTLRLRLDRFEKATGAELGRFEDLVAVWWALESRAADSETGHSRR